MADQNDKTSGELREAKRSSVIDQQLMNQPSSVKNDSLDDEDLDNQEESGGQNNQVDGNNLSESNSQAGEDYANVREQQNQARVEQAAQDKNQEDNVSEKTEEVSSLNPISMATSGALKTAWESLIESFGISILYVDLHFLLNKIVGDRVFPKLGHEWVPKEIAKVGGDKAEEIGKKIEIFETGGCCAVNSCLMVALLISLTPLLLLLYMYNNPTKAAKLITQVFVDLFLNLFQ